MRGEFIRGDGLVTPNNLTWYGAQFLLDTALRGQYFQVRLGLCRGVFDPMLTIDKLIQPSAAHGYAPVDMGAGPANWVSFGTVNGEYYVESKPCVFAATDAAFDQSVSRAVLYKLEGPVLALGGALPNEVVIGPTTPEAQRTFRYRIYLR